MAQENDDPKISDSQALLYAALAKAQAQYPAVAKTRVANVGQYSYRYADLSDVANAIRKPFADNGLAWHQSEQEGWVRTTISHKDGGSFTSYCTLTAPADKRPQAYGSALTYTRRYGLQMAIGFVAEDDDDAAIAQECAAKMPADKTVPTDEKGASEKQLKTLWSMWQKAGYSEDDLREHLKRQYKKESTKQLTSWQASVIIKGLMDELSKPTA